MPAVTDQQPWRRSAYHRAWLTAEAGRLIETFRAGVVNPRGGFFELADDGAPLVGHDGSNVRALHITTRLVFCFTLAHMLGHPGSARLVDHGMAYLWSGHRDADQGGYFWSAGDGGPIDASKQAYGHAHVLLAGASAKTIGHPDADRLIADVVDVIDKRFWEAKHGAVAEEFSRDWQALDTYRGQNSNMHLTEALMAAFEATADERLLRMAESIADLLIRRNAAAHWRVPEHYDEDWRVNRSYAASEMFRPAGTTPGHWLEWSRLLMQLWQLGGRRHAWMPDASVMLFRNAVGEGWDHVRGGFYYTVDFDGRPLNTDKIWWPACEGIGAAAFLADYTGDPFYEMWYRRIWDYAASTIIDGRTGKWVPQRDVDLKAKSTLFVGRPDLYHSLQSVLIPLFPTTGSLLAVLRDCQGPAM